MLFDTNSVSDIILRKGYSDCKNNTYKKGDTFTHIYLMLILYNKTSFQLYVIGGSTYHYRKFARFHNPLHIY